MSTDIFQVAVVSLLCLIFLKLDNPKLTGWKLYFTMLAMFFSGLIGLKLL